MSLGERRRLLRAARLMLDAAYQLDEADEDAFAELASRAAQDLADARRPLTRAGDPAQDLDRWDSSGRERL